MSWSIAAVLCGLLTIAAVQTPPAPAEAVSDAEFDEALECRGYTQMLSALGDPETGKRIHRYWVERSNALGAKRGLSAEQTDFKHLLIEIKADKAKAVLLRCVEATPKKASGLR